MAAQWLNKQNCLLCQNLEAFEAALRLLWRLAKIQVGNPQKTGEFLKLGVALILRYLVTDLLLMQTKLAKIRSSATRPLEQERQSSPF